MPSSLTDTIALSFSAYALSQIFPPLGVYLAALLSKFTKICVNRTVSPSIHTDSAGKATVGE